MSDHSHMSAGATLTAPATDDTASTEAARRADRLIAVTAGLLVIAALVGVVWVFGFIGEERARELRSWQVRLGIVADSRASEIDKWLARKEEEIQALANNPTVQLFVTELDLAGGNLRQVTDGEAQLEYIHNLLLVTADRSGFAGPLLGPEVAANVERMAMAGLAVVGRDGGLLASTPGFTLPGTASGIDLAAGGGTIGPWVDEAGQPALTFHAPVYALQSNPQPGTELAYVVGVKQAAAGLFPLLEQPGSTEASLEAVLLRADGDAVAYISPMMDGVASETLGFARDTEGLASAFALDHPGGFASKRDYLDRDVLVTSRKLANAPWVLMAKIDRSEALAASEARLTRLLIVLLLAIGFAAVAIVAVWRHGASRRAMQAAQLYRQTAEALEQQRNLLRLVTDSQPTSIFILDEGGHFRFANKVAAQSTSVSDGDLLGKSLQAVIGPASAARYITLNEDALASGHTTSGTARLNGSGPERVLASDHIPMQGSGELPNSVLVVERDITLEVTERERRERALDHLVQALVGIVDRRDPYAAEHSKRVGRLSRCIAEQMALDDDECETARVAGTLMNLGKILVPEALLTRRGGLSDEERRHIHESLSATADLLSGVEFSGPVVESLRQAQEHVDGSGFPRHLRGEEILLPARIIAVANAFVGMLSERAHRPGLRIDDAIAELMKASASAYDRSVVAALVNYLDNRGGRRDWQALPPPQA